MERLLWLEHVKGLPEAHHRQSEISYVGSVSSSSVQARIWKKILRTGLYFELFSPMADMGDTGKQTQELPERRRGRQEADCHQPFRKTV